MCGVLGPSEDDRVAMGTYATVLFVMGMSERLADIADPSSDASGLQLEEEHLPQRIRGARTPQRTTRNYWTGKSFFGLDAGNAREIAAHVGRVVSKWRALSRCDRSPRTSASSLTFRPDPISHLRAPTILPWALAL